MIRKFLVGSFVGMAALVAIATPAAASTASWYYTGYWFQTSAACEAFYQQIAGGSGGVDLPHECRPFNGVYELWRMH